MFVLSSWDHAYYWRLHWGTIGTQVHACDCWNWSHQYMPTNKLLDTAVSSIVDQPLEIYLSHSQMTIESTFCMEVKVVLKCLEGSLLQVRNSDKKPSCYDLAKLANLPPCMCICSDVMVIPHFCGFTFAEVDISAKKKPNFVPCENLPTIRCARLTATITERTFSSPASTCPCLHPESRHLSVSLAVCSILQ